MALWLGPLINLHPEITSVKFSGHNHVVSLAHSNGNSRRVVWDNGHKIGLDHLHSVVIDREAEMSVSGTVHKTNSVASSSDEGSLESRSNSSSISIVSVGSVDQAVVESWRAVGRRGDGEHFGGLVRPVVEEEITEILVVIGGCWTVDHDSTENAVSSLDGEMRVIP